MNVSFIRRLTDLFWTSLFVAFFLQFHTLVKLNLRDVKGTKELAVCFLFPLVVAGLALVRFFSRRYLSAPFLFMFSKDDWQEDNSSMRYFSAFMTMLVVGIVLQLTSFALVDRAYMTPTYSPLELGLSVGFAVTAIVVGIFIFAKNKKAAHPVIICLVLAVLGGAGWMLGSGLRAMYELLVNYPQLLRW